MRDGSETIRKPTVLLADDDETMRLLMKESLAQEGFDILEAADGRQALAIAIKSKPDILLLDLVMPKMDGFEVLGELRKKRGIHHLPVMAVTSLEETADVRRAYNAGATDFLTKPIHWPNLGNRIRYMIQASQAFKDLEESRDFLEGIITDIPFLICRWQPDGPLKYVNENYCRYFGKSPDELLGHSFMPLVAEEDRVNVSRHIASLGADNPVGSFEHRVIGSDGEIRWQRWTNRALLDDAGAIREYLSIGEDITDKMKTRERLLLAQEVFENSDELIAITEPDGTIVDVNPAFCRLTGYEREEILGRSVSILSSDQGKEETYRQHAKTLRVNGGWQGEISGRRKNGETFNCIMTINAVRGEKDAVTHFVNISTDISRLREVEDKLQHLAYFEPLTGLPNRTLFTDRLQQAIFEAEREEETVAVIFIDLDNFKDINDSLGHQAGDRLLEMIADRLQESIRRSDSLAHLGGDEFIYFMRNVPSTENLAAIIKENQGCLSIPFALEGQEIFLTSCVGVSIYPNDGKDTGTLIQNADIAMHEAKRKGKHRYQFFSREMNVWAEQRLELQTAMRHGLEQNEFLVYYQPKINIRDKSVSGVEALLRWQRPGQGLVSPGVFIPLAEESELIVAMGEQALRMACSQIKTWQKEGIAPIAVAVNLSAVQLQNAGFADTIRSILEGCSLDQQWLELEITETVIMQDTETAIGILNLIRNLGVSITMDDFGTGYSSLNYLKRFPISSLKIDRSFIADVLKDPDNMEITRAIIAMAHRLRLKVVAEGVETMEQLEFLQREQCDEVQGYYFARPMPAEEFPEWLRSWQAASRNSSPQ